MQFSFLIFQFSGSGSPEIQHRGSHPVGPANARHHAKSKSIDQGGRAEVRLERVLDVQRVLGELDLAEIGADVQRRVGRLHLRLLRHCLYEHVCVAGGSPPTVA